MSLETEKRTWPYRSERAWPFMKLGNESREHVYKNYFLLNKQKTNFENPPLNIVTK